MNFTLTQAYALIVSTLVAKYSNFLKAPKFLSSLFETNAIEGRVIDINTTRYLQLIADDVLAGEKGHYNTQSTKSLKSFRIPGYEEISVIDPILAQLNLEYSKNAEALMTMKQIDDFTNKVMAGDDGSDIRVEKILRSYERLASQLIFTRKNTFVNNVAIDYGARTESFVGAGDNGGIFSDISSDIEKSFQAAFDFIITKGSNHGNRFMVIGQAAEIIKITKNTALMARTKLEKFTWEQVGLNYLERVQNNVGGQYFGTIQIGTCIVDLFSYDAAYDSKDAVSVKVKYCPTEQLAVLPVNQSGGITSDMRFTFGGFAVKDPVSAGGAWRNAKGEFGFSFYPDDVAKVNVNSVVSAGIPYTSNVDAFATIMTEKAAT